MKEEEETTLPYQQTGMNSSVTIDQESIPQYKWLLQLRWNNIPK
jgi:hypothetical protein